MATNKDQICKLFISYSRKDFDKVKLIKTEIEEKTGCECWMDMKSIPSGEEYLNYIADGIENCDIFLFMLSVSSQDSANAIGELNGALKERKRGIHVVIVNIDNCEMNLKFTIQFSTLDTILWSNNLQKEKLIRDINKWANQTFKEDEECRAKEARNHELEKKRLAEEQRKKDEERRYEEEARKRAEAEVRRKAEIETKRKKEQEVKWKAEAEVRQRDAEEARRDTIQIAENNKRNLVYQKKYLEELRPQSEQDRIRKTKQEARKIASDWAKRTGKNFEEEKKMFQECYEELLWESDPKRTKLELLRHKIVSKVANWVVMTFLGIIAVVLCLLLLFMSDYLITKCTNW